MSKVGKKRAVIYSNVKENQRKIAKKNQIQNEQINLNDEFIIGLNNFQKEKKINNQKNIVKKQNVKEKKSKSKNAKESQSKPKKTNNKRKMNPKIKKKIMAIVILVILLILVVVGFRAFLKSSIFNIKQISVKIENNQVITESQIQDISEIAVGQNIYSMKKKDIVENIKRNSYVEKVSIKRLLPNKIEINIQERSVKFQIEENGQYVYIDSQGYILEKSYTPQNCIIIKGNIEEELIEGNRLSNEYLNRLSDVLKILQKAENSNIKDEISSINIENKNDYLIYFDSAKKVAHLGDISSINDKITYIKKILEVESEYEGEIFVNVDLNAGEYPYFREKV